MNLSSDDLCRIIQNCNASGVHCLKISKDGIEIRFGGSKAPESPVPVPKGLPQATLNQPKDLEPLEESERDPKDIDADDELQELQLTDPLEYEARLARGELVDGTEEKES